MGELLKQRVNGTLRILSRLRRTLLPRFRLEEHPRLKARVDSLIHHSRRRTVRTVHGHVMHLDPLDSLGLSMPGLYEAFETAFFLGELRPGSVVLDIGANIGYFTLLFAKAVGPQGHVYAFEPDPENFTLLQSNVAQNDYRNVTLERKAVSATSGVLRLFLCEQNRGDHRIYDSGDGRACVTIESTRLDDYFASGVPNIDLIKMDIQGAEFSAVQGMQNVLRRNPGVVMVTEFWPSGLARQGAQPRAFLELLEGLGFTVSHLDEKADSIAPADFERLLSMYTPANGLHTNLVCGRQSRGPGPGHIVNVDTRSAP